MGSQAQRTGGKEGAGGSSEVVDCGLGQARLQLADPTGGGWQTLRPHIHT